MLYHCISVVAQCIFIKTIRIARFVHSIRLDLHYTDSKRVLVKEHCATLANTVISIYDDKKFNGITEQKNINMTTIIIYNLYGEVRYCKSN